MSPIHTNIVLVSRPVACSTDTTSASPSSTAWSGRRCVCMALVNRASPGVHAWRSLTQRGLSETLDSQ